MTEIGVTLVDVCVLRGSEASLEVLLLRRAREAVRPGTWEGVHGRIDPGETPVEAARREMAEETGLPVQAWYNLSRLASFYRHDVDQVALIPGFVAFVAPNAEPMLSEEHDTWVWQAPEAAMRCCTWPRFAHAIADAVRLFGSGDGGAVESVLRL